MKKIFFPLVSASLILLLTGCFVSELGSMSGRERIEYLQSIKPYGAHWIKEGMTRESRRFDLVTCGSPSGEVVEFSQDLIAKEKNPSEPNDIAAYLRLRNRVGVCMQSKGYTPIGDLQFLGGCDARCLYP